MNPHDVVRTFRNFCLIFITGMAFVTLGALAVHFGMDAHIARVENDELRLQVRDLVGRLAEVEGLLTEVGREREAVEAVTTEALGAVLDTTNIRAESQGQLYLASLSESARREFATIMDTAGPPTSAASVAALAYRTAEIRSRAVSLVQDLKETSRAISLRRDVLAAIPSRLPAAGWISSDFGVRDSPFHAGESMHRGLDIAGDVGTPVYATADGTVEYASTFGGYGQYVRIRHGFGITTRYAHNNELFVKKGQVVRRGELIATLGSTGRSTGPHVHYEVQVHGEAVDPARYLFDGTTFPTAPAAVAVSLKTEIRPMGGDAPELEIAEDQATAGPSGLFQFLPGALSQTKATHLVFLVALLLLIAFSGSLVRLPEVARAADGRTQAPMREPRPKAFELGAWAGPKDQDD